MSTHLELVGVDLEDEWQEDEGQKIFGQDPNVRWFKEYDVYLKHIETPKPTLTDRMVAKFSKNKAPDLLLHFTVCSPAMKKSPPQSLARPIQSAFVQQNFNEESALEFLRTRIASVEVADGQNLEELLSEFLFILPKVS